MKSWWIKSRHHIQGSKADATVVLATAHHGKFLDVVNEALGKHTYLISSLIFEFPYSYKGFSPSQHPILEILNGKEKRLFRLPNSTEEVKNFIKKYNETKKIVTNSFGISACNKIYLSFGVLALGVVTTIILKKRK